MKVIIKSFKTNGNANQIKWTTTENKRKKKQQPFKCIVVSDKTTKTE